MDKVTYFKYSANDHELDLQQLSCGARAASRRSVPTSDWLGDHLVWQIVWVNVLEIRLENRYFSGFGTKKAGMSKG